MREKCLRVTVKEQRRDVSVPSERVFLHGEGGWAGLERMSQLRTFWNWGWRESGLRHWMKTPIFRLWISLRKCKGAGSTVSPGQAGLNQTEKEWLPNNQPWGLRNQGKGKVWSSLAWLRPQQGMFHPTPFWRKLFLQPPPMLEERRKLQSQLENLPTLSLVLKKCKGDELGKLVDVKLYPSEWFRAWNE